MNSAEDDVLLGERPPGDSAALGPTVRRWGGLAFFVLALSSILSRWIYLTGDLSSPFGRYAYSLADLLYGPVWAASLVVALLAIQEQLGAVAPRRMKIAAAIALIAAAAAVVVATIRAANRGYHLVHPELSLETSTSVLVAWTTLVAGLNAAGFHYLGWVLMLIGWSGWMSRRLPRTLSGIYVAAGAASLFVYAREELEGLAITLILVLSIWQGILLSGRGDGAEATPTGEEG